MSCLGYAERAPSLLEPLHVRLVLVLQVAGTGGLRLIDFLARACSETGDGVDTAKHLVPGIARRGSCLYTLLHKAA